MKNDLKNINAFVGGSSKGIGWATARELAQLGANVTLVGRNEQTLKEKLALLTKTEEQTHDYIVLDYTQKDELSNSLKTITKPYQILINNTGGPAGGNIAEEDPEKFEAVFSQHLVINQMLVQKFLSDMQAAGFGRIVNIISVSVKQPIVGLGVSNTIRWAVASWAKTLSKEIAKFGITVNNVLPGYTSTGRLNEVLESKVQATGSSRTEVENAILKDIPTGKFATPEQVAAAVTFLCLPISASINGINLPVDGGLSMSL